MKSIKKILIGIAIILFGYSITFLGLGDDTFAYTGSGISVIGLCISFIGYFFTDDNRN